MKKTIYYQAQFSKDGETWQAFSAHHKYDVVTDYDKIKAIYDEMIKFHSLEWNAACKYHRIAKYEVSETILNVETQTESTTKLLPMPGTEGDWNGRVKGGKYNE